MRKFFGFLASAPISGFIAAAILIAVVWFLSDLVPFFAGTVMWIIIGVILFLYLLLVVIWYWRRRKRNKEMLAQIAPEPDPTGEAITAQQQDLQSKFAAAMRDLSKLKFKSKSGGSRYVYELPWYIFIGPPGAGKTEALKNCGLEFPLRKGDGPISIDGGAGTRDCDWVFTNEAVFIDTAGRYTTQSSNADVDSASWTSFLDLLRKNRPREPINGVIVAISVKDLAVSSSEELDDYAKSIRERLQEVCERMQARVPVYVMFTKADLLIGFTEFFQSMRPKEREQVWGTTFPLGNVYDSEGTLTENLAGVGPDLDHLLTQLGEMHFTRLQEEADLGARSRVFGFPAQFSTLKPVITRFLEQAFSPDRYSTPMLLRGFYFTSATQIGQPVDRLVATLAREFGVEQRAIATLGGSGRSYFLSDLLRKVVFPEQGLITMTAKKRSNLGRYAAIAASILAPVAFAGGLYLVYDHNQAQAASFNTMIEEYTTEVASLPIDPVDDDDYKMILPPLNKLREETVRLKSDDAQAPLLGLGVDDTPVIAERSQAAYEVALDNLLRTRLMYHYERTIEENLHKPNDLYPIFKTYMMLAGAGPLDAEFVKGQVAAEWREEFDPVIESETLNSLEAHLDAMLAKGILSERDLHTEAVAQARDAISQTTMAERAFSALRSSPAALAEEPWTATSAGGPSTNKVFVRRSGRPLDEPIPGIFTYNGFWTFFLANSGKAAKAALDETWLVADSAATKPSAKKLQREISDLYYAEYNRLWQAMLEDLRVAPLGDAESAAKILVTLSSNTSPLKRIIDSTVKETGIAKTPGEDSAAFKKMKVLGTAKFLAVFGKAGQVGAAAASEKSTLGLEVQENFLDLAQFAEGDDSKQLMTGLRNFYAKISQLAAGGEDLKILSTTKEAKELRTASEYAPPAVTAIVKDMLDQADNTSAASVRAQMLDIWSSGIYPKCQSALHGRYPFGGGVEVADDDLIELLAYNGAIDRFFKERLSEYVDQNVRPWRWRPGMGATLGIAQDRLAFFETADDLRQAMFLRGTSELKTGFTVTPRVFDEGVAAVRINIGGTPLSLTPEQMDLPTQMFWPGSTRGAGATVSLSMSGYINPETGLPETQDLPPVGHPTTWGLLKLVEEHGFRERAGGAVGRVRIALGGRSATLEFRMNSDKNIFSLRDAMKAFRCPASL